MNTVGSLEGHHGSRRTYRSPHHRPSRLVHLTKSDQSLEEAHRCIRLLVPPLRRSLFDRSNGFVLQLPAQQRRQHWHRTHSCVAGGAIGCIAHLSFHTLLKILPVGIHVATCLDAVRQYHCRLAWWQCSYEKRAERQVTKCKWHWIAA